MISLGAALENLLITARAYGLRPTVSYFPRGAGNPEVAEVTWANGDVVVDCDTRGEPAPHELAVARPAQLLTVVVWARAAGEEAKAVAHALELRTE